MKNEIETYFAMYFEIRTKIDNLVEKLENKHKQHMNCKRGCDMCCIDYSIFPVEYYAILQTLQKEDFKAAGSNKCACVFLKNNTCTIYINRPIICRTHGLPLLYTNEEGEWELAACELNFVDFDFGEFSLDTTFPQDKFNSKLFLLNREFIANFKEKKYGQFDLIPVKQIHSDLIYINNNTSI